MLFVSAAVLLSVGLWTLGTAQVKIGGDPTTPVTSGAVLELDGASGGLLLPRVQVLPPAALASEGTMYYQIQDGTVYILRINGGKYWEPVGSANVITNPTQIAAKADKLAFGTDSSKLAEIAPGANYVVVENILASTAKINALSANMGRALLDSIRNRSSQGSTTLNAFRDSVYQKIQIVDRATTLAPGSDSTLLYALHTFRDSVYTKNQTLTGVKTFALAPLVPAKSAPAVLANTIRLATEAQVALAQNTLNIALNTFRDSVYTINQTFSGDITFLTDPSIPAKSNAITIASGTTIPATELRSMRPLKI
ncbi:hypothetical protein AGMMS49525_06290 [Bacteroidia bacterium]|nr:hypothetical protein AGMMS49525_06290 [Bacteroidia bacterium]